MKFKKEKFKNLVLYICYKCDPQQLGSVKLNKTLWYSDLITYLSLNDPITGETYRKQQLGPVSSHILPILDELRNGEELVIRGEDYFGYEKKEYIALKKPNLSLFSADEISIVDEVIEVVCYEHTAKSISEKTHDRIWKLADIGEEIPYCTIFASRTGEIDTDDVDWAKQSLGKVA
jgi:hypothetical protein